MEVVILRAVILVEEAPGIIAPVLTPTDVRVVNLGALETQETISLEVGMMWNDVRY